LEPVADVARLVVDGRDSHADAVSGQAGFGVEAHPGSHGTGLLGILGSLAGCPAPRAGSLVMGASRTGSLLARRGGVSEKHAPIATLLTLEVCKAPGHTGHNGT
jgi:hypothetical protein